MYKVILRNFKERVIVIRVMQIKQMNENLVNKDGLQWNPRCNAKIYKDNIIITNMDTGNWTIVKKNVFNNLCYYMRQGRTVEEKLRTIEKELIDRRILIGASELNLIIGLYDKCYSGMIKFDGYDIECLDLSHLRRNYFGIVEQSPIMLFESVRENLRFRETIADREIHFINMDDNDIDFINNNPRNLSGGEKQKIAFARQCYDEMSVLVMDEPTSMLDENAKRKMLKFLQKVKENRIVIIVSHDKQVMENCDYIINMECIAQT